MINNCLMGFFNEKRYMDRFALSGGGFTPGLLVGFLLIWSCFSPACCWEGWTDCWVGCPPPPLSIAGTRTSPDKDKKLIRLWLWLWNIEGAWQLSYSPSLFMHSFTDQKKLVDTDIQYNSAEAEYNSQSRKIKLWNCPYFMGLKICLIFYNLISRYSS